MLILGDGALGRAVETRRSEVAASGRTRGRHGPSASSDALGDRPAPDPARWPGRDLVVEASRGDAVAANLTAALDGRLPTVRHRDDRLEPERDRRRTR